MSNKTEVKPALEGKYVWVNGHLKWVVPAVAVASAAVLFPEAAFAIGTEKVDLAAGYVAFGTEPLKYYLAALSWVSYSAGTAAVLAAARGSMSYIIGTIRAAISAG
jgi:hypothetical protein